MMYLQASWGFVVVIGGLLAALVSLMILDAPAQRRDMLRRQDEHLRANQKRSPGKVEVSPMPEHPSRPNASGVSAQ